MASLELFHMDLTILDIILSLHFYLDILVL